MSDEQGSTTQPERAPTGAGVGGGVPRQPGGAAGGEVGGTGAGLSGAGRGAGDDRGDRPDGLDPDVAAGAPGAPGGGATAGMVSPSGGDRTATTASELTDDPDPGAGGGLDSRGDVGGELTPEPPIGGG